MDKKYLPTLSKIFTSSKIKGLNNPEGIKYLKNILLKSNLDNVCLKKLTIADILDAIYEYLSMENRGK